MPHSKSFSSILGILTAASLVFLPGCATKEKPGRQQVEEANVSNRHEDPQSVSVRSGTGVVKTSQRSKTPVTVSTSAPAPIPPTSPPARKKPTTQQRSALSTETPGRASWTDQVTVATVKEQTGSTILFQKPEAPRRTTSLYEDSILLSKVRGRLLADRAVAKSLESVRVKRGVASLRMQSGASQSVLAAAANAALGVEGIHEIMIDWQ